MPVATSAEHGRTRRQDAARGAPTRDDQATPTSILCVDHHAAILRWLKRLFTREGWNVETAPTAKVAMAHLRSREFSACVIALRLHDLYGLDLVKALRREGIRTPAIVLTGFPSVSSAIEATKLGASYLVKGQTSGACMVAEIRMAIDQINGGTDADPVWVALDRFIDRLTSTWEPLATIFQRARCVFAALVSDPRVSFPAFITATAALRALMADETDPQVVNHLRQQAAKWSNRLRAASDPLLNRLVACIEKRGTLGLTLKKHQAAELLETDLAHIRDLLGDLGLSWLQFRRAVVMRRAICELAHGDEQVTQVAYGLGYGHASGFDRDFHLLVGVTPTQYRQLTRFDDRKSS